MNKIKEAGQAVLFAKRVGQKPNLARRHEHAGAESPLGFYSNSGGDYPFPIGRELLTQHSPWKLTSFKRISAREV